MADTAAIPPVPENPVTRNQSFLIALLLGAMMGYLMAANLVDVNQCSLERREELALSQIGCLMRFHDFFVFGGIVMIIANAYLVRILKPTNTMQCFMLTLSMPATIFMAISKLGGG